MATCHVRTALHLQPPPLIACAHLGTSGSRPGSWESMPGSWASTQGLWESTRGSWESTQGSWESTLMEREWHSMTTTRMPRRNANDCTNRRTTPRGAGGGRGTHQATSASTLQTHRGRTKHTLTSRGVGSKQGVSSDTAARDCPRVHTRRGRRIRGGRGRVRCDQNTDSKCQQTGMTEEQGVAVGASRRSGPQVGNAEGQVTLTWRRGRIRRRGGRVRCSRKSGAVWHTRRRAHTHAATTQQAGTR